ncbi:replicase/polymerase, partial [Nootka lupine vein clearing virus]
GGLFHLDGVCTKIRRGSHPSVVEVEKTNAPKLRRLYKLNTMHSGYQFSIHNNSYQNLRRGLIERVYYVENKQKGELQACPRPEQGVFKEMAYLRRRFVNVCGQHTRISTEQFVDLYQGRKRTIYQQAAESLSERPLDRKDAELRTFVKAEKFNQSKKPDPAPRVIQPRNPRYNVKLGLYLKKFEKHACRALDRIWGGPTVMKGYTVEEVGQHIRGAWCQYSRPVAIGFDMERFDQHVSVPALQFEHSLYMGCFSNDPELRELLDMQLHSFGIGLSSNGYCRYKTEGGRKSGDMNTGLGNCALACLITKHVLRGVPCRLINNGDDCVVVCDELDAARVMALVAPGWARFGFKCIVEKPVRNFEEIVFCQMQPMFDGETWLMVRTVDVALSKDCHSTVRWDSVKQAKKWLRAVGMCGIRLTGGVPIMQEFYQKMVDSTESCELKNMEGLLEGTGFYILAKNSKRGYRAISDEARFSFYLMTGIVPDVQTALEHEIAAGKINMEIDLSAGPPEFLAEIITSLVNGNRT